MADHDAEYFWDLVAKLGEHYQDFVIMARDRKNRLLWKTSDKSWALGAMTRYMNCIDEWDRVDERRTTESEGD